ncbi:hypothetical protein GORBP_020_00180 [Gordonia rubripertincta NBRC 101908]|uniref:Uncharacterized protein n=1 Tax=Gordonia rubripertincta NBRC 101908 TaxID=1077975 RepID=A0ABQ0HNJ2_GORRU|nr:hypothetical protein GORBP_020_00180 [Gordonia rubripertincta NBRC 101908]
MTVSGRTAASSRKNAIAPGEKESPSARMPTNADAHNTTVMRAANAGSETPRTAGDERREVMSISVRHEALQDK